MSHVTRHSHVSHYLLYINSSLRLYNITALNQLPLPSLVVHSTQQVSWSSSSSTYIGIAPTQRTFELQDRLRQPIVTHSKTTRKISVLYKTLKISLGFLGVGSLAIPSGRMQNAWFPTESISVRLITSKDLLLRASLSLAR